MRGGGALEGVFFITLPQNPPADEKTETGAASESLL